MAVASYGSATKSSGVVRILKDLDAAIEGRDVLIVEDIVDSGLTLQYLLRNLAGRNPASLEVCALLIKPERRKVDSAALRRLRDPRPVRDRATAWITPSATATCPTSRRFAVAERQARFSTPLSCSASGRNPDCYACCPRRQRHRRASRGNSSGIFT